jgi:S1-C subfamily serine protease
MSRQTKWMIAGAFLALSLLMVVAFGRIHPFRTKMMSGPVAIVQGKAPTHGMLGVEFNPMAAAPLTIEYVLKGSGADEAGLQADDVIVAINKTKNPDLAQFRELLQASEPGDRLVLKIRRGQEEFEVGVRLISFAETILLREGERNGKTTP